MDAETAAALARIESILVRIDRKLDRAQNSLENLLIGDLIMSAELDALSAQVANNTDVEASAVQLLENISQLLRDAGTDRTKLTALANNLETSRTALAAAIVANTPVAVAPTP